MFAISCQIEPARREPVDNLPTLPARRCHGYTKASGAHHRWSFQQRQGHLLLLCRGCRKI